MSLREKVDNLFNEQINRKPKRTTNGKCEKFVEERVPFNASNLYAQWEYPITKGEPAMYVVYSWGKHFPLYIWEPVEREWFKNTTGSTNSTHQHRYDAGIANTKYLPLDTDTMIDIITRGIRPVFKELETEEAAY
jgi:hypothetical protein